MVKHYQMPGEIRAIDPMVVRLAAEVIDVLDDNALTRFELAASEAITNVVKHGLRGQEGRVVDIDLTKIAETVVLDIFDPEGVPVFDPRENVVALDEVDTKAETGRGLGLLMHCVNEIFYGEIAGRRRLSLRFWNEGSNASEI